MKLIKIALILLAVTSLASCKIDLNVFGDGEVSTESGTFSCVESGSPDNCSQEYVTDITQCDNYTTGDTWDDLPDCTLVRQLLTDVTECDNYTTGDTWTDVSPDCQQLVNEITECYDYTTGDDWVDLPHCVQTVDAIEDCDDYSVPDYDTWDELTQCTLQDFDGLRENWVATPDEDDSFDGFYDACTGAGCSMAVDYDTAADDNASETINAYFNDEPTPQDASYTYNYLGQRVSKTVGATTTYYLYDLQGNLIDELDSSGNSIKTYIYMEGEYIGHIEQTGDTGAGQLEEQAHYALTDHLGQPYMTIRATGNLGLAGEQYMAPFGKNHAVFVADFGATDPEPINQRFPGQYYDKETGYHQNWNRYYDPSIGRYLQSDPIGLAGGINTYGYAYQNPVMYTDPYGLNAVAGAVAGSSLGPAGTVVGAAIGGILGYGLYDAAREWWEDAANDADGAKQQCLENSRKQFIDDFAQCDDGCRSEFEVRKCRQEAGERKKQRDRICRGG